MLVSNLIKAKDYYQSLFDLNSKPHPTDKKMLMLENPQIHFFIKEVPLQALLKEQHLSIQVKRIDDFIERLHKYKIINYQTGEFNNFQYRNYKWVEWQDPDGIRLECIETI